ncbi:DUF6082 family protein [Streptomyces fildesensis]|uniref:DUF6082 family protein n=1 Tax=Streptomyces fildesensis TaxID=375757 RepID=A0ABW8C984_9ACTN
MSGLLFLGLILVTPFFLRAVGPSGTDWAKLSEISQTYGAVSVPLSMVALAGVIASLAYQARQTRIAQAETNRSSHRELVLLAISKPELRQCWEPPVVAMTTAEWERIAFTNLILSGWENAYRLGSLTDVQLRLMLTGHFRGGPARTHWSQARTGWLELAEEARDRRARGFAVIAEECFQAAVAAGTAVAGDDYFAR